MEPSRTYKLWLISFALTLIIFFSFTLPPNPESGGNNKEGNREDEAEEVRKKVLGSRPPACMNKCMSCRPCETSLVIPPHKDIINAKRGGPTNYVFQKSSSSSSHREDDDSYYLLSWKCRCGNRIYQP